MHTHVFSSRLPGVCFSCLPSTCLFRPPSFPYLSFAFALSLPLSFKTERATHIHTHVHAHTHTHTEREERERESSLSLGLSLSLALSRSRALSLAVTISLASHRIPPPLPPLLCLFFTCSRTRSLELPTYTPVCFLILLANFLPFVLSLFCPPARASALFLPLGHLAACSQCPCAGMQGVRYWLAIACILLGGPHLERAQGP